MKTHTPEQVEGLRSWINQSVSPDKQDIAYRLGQHIVNYSIIPIETGPYPNAIAAAYVPEDDIVIGVPDSVPKKLRGLWAMHEYIDFAVIGHSAPDRCIQSERIILDELFKRNDKGLSYDYSKLRIPFFNDTANFMRRSIEASETAYSRDDVRGCYDAVVLHAKRLRDVHYVP